MGTRARIGIREPSGEVTSVYTHWDGYPEHHFPILTEHYDGEDRVRALLDLGDLSVLAPNLGEQHDFDAHDPASDSCLAYGRDRGEHGCEAVTHPAEEWPDCDQEYEYVFDGGWHIRTPREERD
jgi:hypothetical protein